MAELKFIQGKMRNSKLKLSDLNPHLICVLCGGYYIDATTIVECLHSFCRSCIVKHLESSKYCPICEVQVHKTKPLINIRADKTLQDIVYKLVPGLFASEMQNRRRFYRERPHYIKPNDSESAGEVSGERKVYVNDENITFSLVYHEGPGPTNTEDSCREFPPPAQNERRYFKCPTGVTVQHLKKLLRAKYELSESNYKLEMYLREQELHEELTLLDISYVYLWKTKGTLDLTYKIFENVVKRQKREETAEGVGVATKEGVKAGKEEVETRKEKKKVQKKEEKKVQKKEEKKVQKKEEKKEQKKEDKKEQKKEDKKEQKKEEKKEQKEEKKEQKEEKKEQKEEKKEEANEVVLPEKKEREIAVSKGVEKDEGVKTQGKENGVTGSEAKEVQLQISESGVMSVSQVEDSRIVRTVEESGTKVRTNEMITGVGVGVGVGVVGGTGAGGRETKGGEVKRAEKPAGKVSKPYKTIRCSPKTWHPVIPKEKLRPTLMKNSDEPRKPLKFFKMRNMPRFLGNPSSGVKPLFAEAADKPEEKKSEVGKTVNKILKIDPKTLRPIEKEELKMSSTPSAPNLLTNPFIPNNNHFLFSDLRLLPPNAGNYKEKPSGAAAGFKAPVPNGTYPPICFPTPEHSPPGFYPFAGLTKPQSFPFPDKMDPLLRASRLSPFGNLAAFNVAGFHASLPPSISRLLNPHQHFRKINQTLEKKNKDESTKETTKRCDDSFKVSKGEEEEQAEAEEEVGVRVGVEGKGEGEREGRGGEGEGEKGEKRKEEDVKEEEGQKEKQKDEERVEKEGREEEEEKEKKDGGGEGGGEGKEMNGETSESASELKLESSNSAREKDREKDKDR